MSDVWYRRPLKGLLLSGGARFKVKPHAADFFVRRSIRRNDKFVYLLYTSPSRGQVLIYPSRWNPASDRAVEEIVKLIRGFKDDIEPVILG